MKTWSTDNPKARLMERKRAAIVNAAQQAFLETGYAETSMNRIAEDAGVSIKTVYRHFENKDDLFTAVIQAACDDAGRQESQEGDEPDLLVNGKVDPAWLAKKPATALTSAAERYLRHVLSDTQLALLRIVIRDAAKFPELATRYRQEITERHQLVLETYLRHWAAKEGWRIRNYQYCADTFLALLRSGVVEEALLGLPTPAAQEVAVHARFATKAMLRLLESLQF